MRLSPDFREFIQSLNDNGVRYLVVGGYAVAFHGHPRYTKDIDFWVWLDDENSHNIIRALDQLGFGSLDLTAEDFTEPDQIIQLGFPPNRIDLITTLEGVSFPECYSSRIVTTIEGIAVDFIDLDNLRKNKGDFCFVRGRYWCDISTQTQRRASLNSDSPAQRRGEKSASAALASPDGG